MAANPKDVFTVHNKVEVIRGGAEYFRLVQQIADGARYSLHLHTYIFDEDETGMMVADALVRAARRNVLVYLLVDGYASQHLSKEFISYLKKAGVHFRFFMPLLKSRSFYIGRRLHHKVVVADGHKSLVAGINVSNRYNDVGDTHAWLDWAVYAEGEAARILNDVCVSTWNRSLFSKKCEATNNPFSFPQPPGECLVQVCVNDWVLTRTQITRTYHKMFADAVSGVTVMSSYFWPPPRLLARMARASRRGVKIRLVLTAHADVPFAKYAERYLYRWLFRHNIDVFEYQRNVLHGKVAVSDGHFVTLGSYNVNNISAFASVELNLNIKDTGIATSVTDRFNEIIANDCVQIDRDKFWTSNSPLKKLMFFLSYRLVQIAFFLFTFYYVQHREKD